MTNKDEIPAGHENGIHMFGSAAAENLKNPLYVWKADAPKIYVYYKLNTAAAENNGDDANGAAVTASNFTIIYSPPYPIIIIRSKMPSLFGKIVLLYPAAKIKICRSHERYAGRRFVNGRRLPEESARRSAFPMARRLTFAGKYA